MAKTIFVGNYKGGVGKTTSVLNFATHFANLGKKVLVIDLDPQSSLSEILVSNSPLGSLANVPDGETLNYVIDLNIEKIKRYKSISLNFNYKSFIKEHFETNKKVFDFIVSSLFYKNGGLDDLVIKMEDNIEYLSILKQFIDEIIGNYDYLFIDCPPSNNLITKAMFLMSDYYIIPTILDKLSIDGIAHYISVINKTYEEYCVKREDNILFKHYFGNKPELIGIFRNLIRQTVGYADELNYLNSIFNAQKIKKQNGRTQDILLEGKIDNLVDISRLTSSAKSSSSYYGSLLDEVFNIAENGKTIVFD